MGCQSGADALVDADGVLFCLLDVKRGQSWDESFEAEPRSRNLH
jgi:hypothetical protein